MTGEIRHRGPDDFGHYHHGPVSLGQRRLSIVDVAGGHQPLPNEDESAWIIFNGEIFNHAGLRPALEQKGHRYRTRSDTEAILHAWEEHGAHCIEPLRGMFAFVIWDEKSQTLFGARDRLGIKPFYYFWDGRTFVFASEIKALLQHPALSAEPEEDLLAEYLCFGYVSEERTMFRNIRKLMPGHHFTIRYHQGCPQLSIERYWDVPQPQSYPGRSDAEWIAAVREGLEETVRMRLMADVPLGTFLSGGLDSSAVTALVGRMVSGKVKTFSVGYAEEAYSELSYAAQVSRVLGTDHHEVVLGRDEFFAALPRLVWHEDEPITWPSSVSLFFVSRLAAQHVKVVLTGEGSDELFGGYERYRWNLLNTQAQRFYSVVPTPLRRMVRHWMAESPLLNASIRRKVKHTFLGRDEGLESLYLDNFYGAFSLAEQTRLMKHSPRGLYANFLHNWEARPTSNLLDRMLYADQKTYLLELLMKQDQMSMATSIESRVPFLDHHFVALAMSVPTRLKIQGGEQKAILKKAVEDLLPHDIVYRKKMGFPTPLRQWFREPASDALLKSILAPNAFVAQYLDQEQIRLLLEKHRGGREDATDRLWRLLNLEIWGGLFFGTRKDSLLEASAHLAS